MSLKVRLNDVADNYGDVEQFFGVLQPVAGPAFDRLVECQHITKRAFHTGRF